jgi:integrase
MRWADISADGVWSIPTERGEKNNGGRLQLPPAALAIIHQQPHFASSPHVFQQRRPSTRAVALFQKSCNVQFRLHDLRRTHRTILSRIGVSHEVAESVLGHSLPGISGIYNRDSFEPQKAAALAELAATVERIVDPSPNVVAMVAP